MCNEMTLCSAPGVRAVTSSDGRSELGKLNHFGALLNPSDSPAGGMREDLHIHLSLPLPGQFIVTGHLLLSLLDENILLQEQT